MRWGVILAAGLTLGGCASAPITGRDQLNLVSDATVMKASRQEFSQFINQAQRKNAVVTGGESTQSSGQVAMVQRVGNRIIDAAGLRGTRNWRIFLVKSPSANAFVTPDGNIVVFTGLLPVAKSEAALAGVLGHEVAHVMARHSAERMSHVLAGQIALAAVDAALSNSKHRPLIGAAVGLGIQYGVLLPYSREHESEADHIGMLLAARAGYDPVEFAEMWRRMEARKGATKWEFASTHPSAETRHQQLTEWLPEARIYYAEPSRPLPANLAEIRVAREQSRQTAALAPEGAKPGWAEGATFKVRRSNGADRDLRIERKTPCGLSVSCFAVTDASGDYSLYDDELALIETRSGEGTLKFDPPLQNARFPVRVGDSWMQDVKVDNGTRQIAWKAKGDVVTYESVTVPAGSFMAFKIVLTVNGRRLRELWWSPGAAIPVKTITHNLTTGTSITAELVDYPHEADPASGVGEDDTGPGPIPDQGRTSTAT